MKRVFLLALAFMLLFSSVAAPCELCKYSPNGWGFCRIADADGDGSYTCTEVVLDTFNGTTGCKLEGMCRGWFVDPGKTGGGGGGGGADECWWTDLYGGCILAY